MRGKGPRRRAERDDALGSAFFLRKNTLESLVIRFFASIALLVLGSLHAQEKLPRVLDDGHKYRLDLLAEAPELVTPVGLAFDSKKRLLIIESHTHFRPKDYQGPKADRIRIFDETKPKGEQFSTFYEGSVHTMSIACALDGWVYVATRAKIFRIRDSKKAGKADEEEILAHLDTTGNYPHNGLCGLCLGRDGWLYFGMGENLGIPYKLLPKIGPAHVGGGEGGNVFRMKPDGSQMARIATGIWNPFGLYQDARGRLLCVDNDPDAKPPCRLLHIVPGGDYGFQFRYGRAGNHPLQAWDGELPGTLPMIAGTGEAPCNLLEFHGRLWVSSWGDYRLESYTLEPLGATLKAERHIVVQGDQKFRPVGLTVGPDGALYFTDWVQRSYPVHGQGRLWRLTVKDRYNGIQVSHKQHEIAERLRVRPELTALDSFDPFIHQAAVWGFSQQPTMPAFKDLKSARQRLGILQAHRWLEKDADAILPLALVDADPDVRLLAVRWVADADLKKFKPALEEMLVNPTNTLPLTRGAIAALAWLEHGALRPKERKVLEDSLTLSLLKAHQQTAVGVSLLRSLPANHVALTNEMLAQLFAAKNPALKREVVWTAIAASRGDRGELLEPIVRDESLPPSIRADAMMGVDVMKTRRRIERLANDAELERTARYLLRTFLRMEKRPDAKDIDAWLKIVETGGDAEMGRRIFFAGAGVKCATCHAIQGRGAGVGPDLTFIARQGEVSMLRSILQPSQNIAPQYQALILELVDGKTLTGYAINKIEGESRERFMGADGKEFIVPNKDVVERLVSPLSIMPHGVEQTMTLEDFRDLFAYLRTLK